jgi:ABC-type glycerol-3-phosphate transport system substrate-binding protein
MLRLMGLLALVATIVAACGSAPSSTAPTTGAAGETAAAATSNEPVEIVFAVNVANDQRSGWTDLVETANKELAAKNITIVMQNTATTSWPEYYQKITAQMAAGNVPDIGRIAESFMPTLIEKGQVVDLSGYMPELDMSQYYEETFKNAGYRDGKNYGLPSGVFYMVMYYNKSLFDQAGLPYPSGDWTSATSFAEVKENAQQLTSGTGENKTWGFYAGPYMGFIGMYAQSNGGKNVLNDDQTCALTEPEALEVYQWFDEMMRVDKTMPTPTDLSVVGPGDLFLAGKLAMTVDGTWFLPQVLEKAEAFDVGIAAVPSGKGEAYSSQFVDNWVIWKGSKHEQESWEALKALYSAAGWQTLAASGEAGIPVHRETTSKLLDETISSKLGAENKTTFEAALDHTISVPYNSFYQEVDELANNSMDEWRLEQITYQQYAEKVCGFINDAVQTN